MYPIQCLENEEEKIWKKKEENVDRITSFFPLTLCRKKVNEKAEKKCFGFHLMSEEETDGQLDMEKLEMRLRRVMRMTRNEGVKVGWRGDAAADGMTW